MVEEAFTKEFALEAGFGGTGKSPEDQRLAAFEARAAQEVEALTKVTLRNAFETDRWNGALTRGGRLDVVKGSVRDEVFRVLGEEIEPTDNSAESRLWKYDYPGNTLKALEDRKYSAEQVAIQPLEGFATILRSLEQQSQREINAEVARLKEIEAHEATLRHLQDNFDGDKGIQ
ncbi:MAG TPA: hypothetical protein VIT68_05235, partial [Candidatus Gracilibacteria bacterium]